MFRFVGSKIVPLTPELAASVSTMEQWKGERGLRPKLIAHLSARLAAGEFHNPRWAFATINGIRYRVNGQHSSNVLANANRSFPKNLSVVIDEYECSTDEDMAMLFEQFDQGIHTRTKSEGINAHARIHSDLDSISQTTIKCAIEGIAKYKSRCEGDMVYLDKSSTNKLVHNETAISFIKWAQEYMRGKGFRRISIVAAMYGTWLKDPASASNFWKLVQEESHPSVDHATRELSRFIRSLDVDSIGEKWDARAVYSKTVHAWNAYRRGCKTQLKYSKKSPIPKII